MLSFACSQIQPPYCTQGKNFYETNCGHFYAAVIYFCSYYVIITYIMLNLLVGTPHLSIRQPNVLCLCLPMCSATQAFYLLYIALYSAST